LQEALRIAAAISAHICDSGKANARPAAMLGSASTNSGKPFGHGQAWSIPEPDALLQKKGAPSKSPDFGCRAIRMKKSNHSFLSIVHSTAEIQWRPEGTWS
jgi:hypothetical protein